MSKEPMCRALEVSILLSCLSARLPLSEGSSAGSEGLREAARCTDAAGVSVLGLCWGQLSPSVRSALPLSPWPVIYGIN